MLVDEFARREFKRRAKCTYKVASSKKKPNEFTAQEKRMHDILYKDRFDHNVNK